MCICIKKMLILWFKKKKHALDGIRSNIAGDICVRVTCLSLLDWRGNMSAGEVYQFCIGSDVKQQDMCCSRIDTRYHKGRLHRSHRVRLHPGPVSRNFFFFFTWPYVERHFNFHFGFQQMWLEFFTVKYVDATSISFSGYVTHKSNHLGKVMLDVSLIFNFALRRT